MNIIKTALDKKRRSLFLYTIDYPSGVIYGITISLARGGYNGRRGTKALNGKVATQDGLMNAIKAVVGKYR